MPEGREIKCLFCNGEFRDQIMRSEDPYLCHSPPPVRQPASKPLIRRFAEGSDGGTGFGVSGADAAKHVDTT